MGLGVCLCLVGVEAGWLLCGFVVGWVLCGVGLLVLDCGGIWFVCVLLMYWRKGFVLGFVD